jgi:hypothetical protein
LRHAGVAGGTGDETVDRPADLPDLNHGKAGEQDKKAQNQPETAEYPRTDTDRGQHEGQFHWIPKILKEST